MRLKKILPAVIFAALAFSACTKGGVVPDTSDTAKTPALVSALMEGHALGEATPADPGSAERTELTSGGEAYMLTEPGKLDGHDGTLSLTYLDDVLVEVAFEYEDNDADAAVAEHDGLHGSFSDAYGDPSLKLGEGGNYVTVWAGKVGDTQASITHGCQLEGQAARVSLSVVVEGVSTRMRELNDRDRLMPETSTD